MATHSQDGFHTAFAVSPSLIKSKCIVDIGSSGAATLNYTNPGWTVTNTGTGTYDGTFPICRAQSASMATLRGWVQKSAAKTVGNVIITAVSYTAGTFSFTTAITAGTAANPASGDQLAFELEATNVGAY